MRPGKLHKVLFDLFLIKKGAKYKATVKIGWIHELTADDDTNNNTYVHCSLYWHGW